MYLKSNSPWLIFYKKTASPKLTLVCFHYAGGTASYFSKWKDYLPADIDLISIQLPGRELRILEALTINMQFIVSSIVDSLSVLKNQSFIFLGHSLGSILSFEVSRVLNTLDTNSLKYLIFSSSPAPHIIQHMPKLHLLSDTEFITSVNEIYGGIHAEILNNSEILELLLPRLRADFTLAENYKYVCDIAIPLPISILVIGGDNDSTVNQTELLEWHSYTSKDFNMHLFQGDHFYINNSIENIMNLLKTYVL